MSEKMWIFKACIFKNKQKNYDSFFQCIGNFLVRKKTYVQGLIITEKMGFW